MTSDPISQHLERVGEVRGLLAEERYGEALGIGLAELERGAVSAELLVLLSAAAELGEDARATLDDARRWLEAAVALEPKYVEASIDLGQFLDAVAGESQRSAALYRDAAVTSAKQLEDAVSGLIDTGVEAPELLEETKAALTRCLALLEKAGH